MMICFEGGGGVHTEKFPSKVIGAILESYLVKQALFLLLVISLRTLCYFNFIYQVVVGGQLTH